MKYNCLVRALSYFIYFNKYWLEISCLFNLNVTSFYNKFVYYALLIDNGTYLTHILIAEVK